MGSKNGFSLDQPIKHDNKASIAHIHIFREDILPDSKATKATYVVRIEIYPTDSNRVCGAELEDFWVSFDRVEAAFNYLFENNYCTKDEVLKEE